jgi:hypothetical protein
MVLRVTKTGTSGSKDALMVISALFYFVSIIDAGSIQMLLMYQAIVSPQLKSNLRLFATRGLLRPPVCYLKQRG